MIDYYTLWMHQIKTPIFAMQLLLSDNASSKDKALSAELFKIEQYVSMALNYLRLDSHSGDLLIRPCRLDAIIRQVIRKFAPLFIRKKLAIDYTPVNLSVLTDEKWLAFMIEQLLSNAIKYTTQGTVFSIWRVHVPLRYFRHGHRRCRRICRASLKKALPATTEELIKKLQVSGFISAGVPQTCCHIHCALNLCLTTAQASISVFTQSRRSMTNAALQPSFQKCNIHGENVSRNYGSIFPFHIYSNHQSVVHLDCFTQQAFIPYSTGGFSMSVLEVKNLKKIYTTRFGGQQVQALSNVSFAVENGEYVAIMGESSQEKQHF